MNKISDIKLELEQASVHELPGVMLRFADDEREGVKKLLVRAQKKLDAYEKELARTENMKIYERKYSDFSYICGL